MNGKILQSEIINRKNDPVTKVCFGFEYELSVDDGNDKQVYPIRFTRVGDKTWEVEMIFNLQVYRIMYDVPKNSLDITLIAAFGLKNLQYQIEQEVQMKSIIDFSIGDEIREM